MKGPNVIILRQDKRVGITQQPKKTALKMGEKLVQGDHPIVEYRRRRQELMEGATQPSPNEDATWPSSSVDAMAKAIAGRQTLTMRANDLEGPGAE